MIELNEMTDEELAMAYVGGDNRAFDLLLSRCEVKLFNYILFVVHDEEMANDIFQDTFVKAIVRLQEGQYAPNGKFLAWLMRIAHNVIIDVYRDPKRQCVVTLRNGNDLSRLRADGMEDSFAERELVRQQVLGDVSRLVGYLPANQREVVYMRYYQQLSFKEIADLTQVSINTSLGRMRYALINMRRMAKEHHISLQID